ncbi:MULTISPECIES: hypothetical protein [unclassified Pseudoclavibacter]|uniref:hypothetical protein n=1 Tax=unclassified Pseudoclavibacter TaxID=2615177 RepID=UPI0011AFE287|nr:MULTISPECIES: hypothetical protein [unclassified Pseudoclavibacter]
MEKASKGMSRQVVITSSVVALILGTLVWLGVANSGEDEGAPVIAATATPSPTRTPKATVPEEPMVYTYACSSLDSEDASAKLEFATLPDVWAAERIYDCGAQRSGGKGMTTTEQAAYDALGGGSGPGLGWPYAICANGAPPRGAVENKPDYLEAIEIALKLCPEAPHAAELEALIDPNWRPSDVTPTPTPTPSADPNKVLPGVHRVGETVQPGTYYSESAVGFQNCYWEMLDSAGNIIDNNFASSALRVEVTILAEAYSFSSSGCGTWQLLT